VECGVCALNGELRNEQSISKSSKTWKGVCLSDRSSRACSKYTPVRGTELLGETYNMFNRDVAVKPFTLSGSDAKMLKFKPARFVDRVFRSWRTWAKTPPSEPMKHVK
jgi:hypothetical protein